MSQLRPAVADREHRENPRWAGGAGGTGSKSQGYFSNSSDVVWVVCFVFFFNVAPAQSAPNCLNTHQSPSIPSATRNRPAAPCARLMKEAEEQSGCSQGGAEAAAPNGALSLFYAASFRRWWHKLNVQMLHSESHRRNLMTLNGPVCA